MDKQYIEHLERLAETAARLEAEISPVLRSFRGFMQERHIQALEDFRNKLQTLELFKTENPQNE